MKKIMLVCLCAVMAYSSLRAQNVAINANGAAPHSSAMLDVSSISSGLLIPRMSAVQRAAISSPANGLLVYQLDGTAGYYYFNGTAWVPLFSSNTGWSLTGNAGTSAASNFIGTTDANDLVFRTGNVERARLTSGGIFLIGMTTPIFSGDKLDVIGNYAINGVANISGGIGVWAENTFAAGTALIAQGNGSPSAQVLTNGSGASVSGAQIGFASFRTNTTNVDGQGAAYFLGSSNLTQYSYVSYRSGGIWYKIIGTGSVSTIVHDKDNQKQVTMFAPESPEIFFQDYGHGRLVNGKATVTLDRIFTQNISVDETRPLKVFIQLEGDCKGVYVTNKSAGGFEVIELQGGTSNVSFTWSVTANRADEVDPVSGEIISRNAAVRFPDAPAMAPARTLDKKAESVGHPRP